MRLHAYAGVVGFELLQYVLGTLHDRARHTRYFSHMNTERVLRSAAHQLAQEDNLAVKLLHRHIVVLYTLEVFLHLVQLVIVSGEERARLRLRVLVKILHDSPGDGDAVVGRRAAAQLVEEHERTRRHVVQDVRRFGHFYHEGRLAERYVVRRSDAGEYLVDDTHMSRVGRHEAAHLRHERDERRLAQQRRLTSHVRTGDYHYLLLLGVELDVVGHVLLAKRQLRLDDGVASGAYLEHVVVLNHRAHVAVLLGSLCEREQTVETRHDVGVGLNLRYVRLHIGDKLGEETGLEHQNLLVGTHNLLLVLLQFLGDVALGVGKRLLAYPLLRHLVLIRVAHLKIVAEHVVVAHLQRLYAGLLRLLLLNLQQIVATAARDGAQLVKLRREARSNHAALSHKLRRILLQFAVDALVQRLAEVNLVADGMYLCVVVGEARRLYRLQRAESVLQLHHLSGRHSAHSHLRYDTLYVANAVQMLVYGLSKVGFAEERVHHVEALVDRSHVAQREYRPAAQQTSAHRRAGAVDDGEQRHAVVLHRLQQLQRVDGEAVEAHIAVGVDASERRDVANLRVLRHLKILQDGSSRCHAQVQMVYAEALQRCGAEV